MTDRESLTVVYLHPHFTQPGGAGRFVLETARILADRGCQVHVICIRADSGYTSAVDDRVRFHELGGPLSSSLCFWITFPRAVSAVRRAVRAICGNTAGHVVLFPQVFPANWWAALVSGGFPDMPVIWYCHEPSAFIHSAAWKRSLPWPSNWLAVCLSPALAVIDRWFCSRFVRVLANSAASCAAALRIYRYPASRCTIVPPGVQLSPVTPAQLQVRQPWVTFVGRISAFKRVPVLIEAFARVIRRGVPDVVLNIAGSGDDERTCHHQVRDLGLSRRIRFLPDCTDGEIRSLMAESKAVCLASLDEPFGLVVLESLAVGTPVVAVGNGGPVEILNGLKCGWLCPEGSASEFAEGMGHFLEMPPDKFQEVTAAALARAEDYSWDRTADAILQEVRTLMSHDAPQQKIESCK